jgi:hypothetical protein
MISVTQGPKNNAGLAALDYNKTFEAGAEGVRKIAQAKDLQSAEIKQNVKDMQTKFEQAQITASKVQAAISQNPMLFQGLEEGTDMTSKSYQKFLNGDYSPQNVNNLNAYIDAANTQKQNADVLQQQQDTKTAASALTDIIKLQFPENSTDDEIDSVTQSDLTRTMLNYMSTKDLTPGAQERIFAGIQKYGQNLSTTDEFAYDAKIESNMKAFDSFSDAYSKGDTAAAMRAISTSPLYSEYINVKDITGEIIRQRSADEIAAILGISQPKPDAPEDDDEDYSDDSGVDAAVEALSEGDLNDKSLTRYYNFKSKDLNESIETAAEVDVAMDMKKSLKVLFKELKHAEDKLADRNFTSATGLSLDKSYYQNQVEKKKSAILDIIEQLDKMLKVESDVENKSTAQLESEVFK